VTIAGVTIIEGGMETDERERSRRPRRGAARPVSPDPPGPRHSRESGNLPMTVIPAQAGISPPFEARKRRIPPPYKGSIVIPA